MWYQNSFLLSATDRKAMRVNGDRHVLVIKNFHHSDYGNYRYYNQFILLSLLCYCSRGNCKLFINYLYIFFSCVADNALGRTKKYIEVSGRPGQAQFLSSAFSASLDQYNLTWTIESIPPIESIRLLYRRIMVIIN